MIDFKDYTFETILGGMLSRIGDDLDKREGSIIYDALAPAAYEIASLYRNLEVAFEESFVFTATGEALDSRGAEMGITRRPAVKAVRLGKFYNSLGEGLDLEPGLRFATPDRDNSVNFVVLEKVDTGVYHLEAEEGGAGANHYVGDLLPAQYISGLARAEVVGEPIVDGADGETDEEYRERYLYKVGNEPFGGNAAQYLQWALEYPGIGKAKVFPLWQGENTVKVSILGTDDRPCSQQLIEEFQEYLDPRSEGLGNGAAPIGAKVTVTTATPLNIVVVAKVTLDSGAEAEQCRGLIEEALNSYFKEIAYEGTRVFYMKAGAAILSVPGVAGVTALTLNGATADLDLGPEDCPYLSSLTLEVTP